MARNDCVYVAIDTYTEFEFDEFEENISYRCYPIDFLLESVKMEVFAGDYSKKPSVELMKLAGTTMEKGSRSDDPKESLLFKKKIIKTIKKLIKMNRITFLKSIEIMEKEPRYEERHEKPNYFMMYDTDFAQKNIIEAEQKLKDRESQNLFEYEKYADQFDSDA